MRILKLRLINLNSLTGEWAIDFTHPDYQAGGLFAITGPTGVGKTTVPGRRLPGPVRGHAAPGPHHQKF